MNRNDLNGMLWSIADILRKESEHLTYRDCSEYIRLSYGDESQSRCKITGVLCVADEAGEQCSMWEEEKAEIFELLEALEADERGEGRNITIEEAKQLGNKHE